MNHEFEFEICEKFLTSYVGKQLLLYVHYVLCKY